MKDNKGQVSSFLKPIQVIIFASIFVVVLILFLNFELGLEEQSSSLSSDENILTAYQKISSCASVESSRSPASFLIDQRKVARYDREYSKSQLPCAHSYGYSYNVTVNPLFLGSLSTEIQSESPADVVFALDDSGSMGTPISEVRQNTKNFIEALPQGSRVGMFTYADEIDNKVELTDDPEEVTSVLDSIPISGSFEFEDLAIKVGINEFDYDAGKRKILVILATEAADKGSGTEKCGNGGKGASVPISCLNEWADEASSEGIEIYTIADRESVYKQIAERTGGKYFDVTADYSNVFEEIAGDKVYAGGGNTCTLPPVERYSGTVDVVFAADSSSSFQDEWGTVCKAATNTQKNLEERGINASVSVYAPGNPGSISNGQGSPMQVDGEDYNHSEASNVPSCIKSDYNNASSIGYGKGITEWESSYMPEYNSSTDYGYESWGAFSKWILENHDWREGADHRKMYVFGDQVPTGGNETSESFKEKVGHGISNGTELVGNITELANSKNIEINTFRGDEWEYGSTSMVEPFSENDAKVLMRRTAANTAGTYGNYTDIENVGERVAEIFKGIEGSETGSGFCKKLEYSFGEETSSPESTVRDRRTLNYPVAVSHEDVKSKGRMEVELRESELSDIGGQIQKVIDRGKETGETVSAAFRFSPSVKVSGEEISVEKKKTSTYKLVEGDSHSSEFEVSDKLVVGVNGEEVARYEKSEDEQTVTADFGSNSFEAYEGAYIQHIAVNRDKESGMLLENFDLECTSCTPVQRQPLVDEEINSDEGSSTYKERGGIGVFEHASTEINIGEKETVNKPGVCLGEGSNAACRTFNVDEISEISLEPGSYLLNIEYDPETGEVVIND